MKRFVFHKIAHNLPSKLNIVASKACLLLNKLKIPLHLPLKTSHLNHGQTIK